MSIDSLALEQSVRRLFPNQALDQVLVELLLERAKKNLVKYRTLAASFRPSMVRSLTPGVSRCWIRSLPFKQNRTISTGRWP